MKFFDPYYLRKILLGVFTAILLLGFFGCTEENSEENHPDAGDADASSDSLSEEDTGGLDGTFCPEIADLHEGWNRVTPGGETLCDSGGEFSYWIRPGTVNRLIVLLDGGGACWDNLTCSLRGVIFFNDIPEDFQPSDWGGILDLDNPENPFKDWHFVFVDYCTGDAHWGDRTYDYSEEGGANDVVIRHLGYINTNAAVQCIFANYDDPEAIVIAGGSAGGYGTLLHAPHFMRHYTNSRVIQLVDCGTGVAPSGFFESVVSKWGADNHIPDWIPEIASMALEDFSVPDLFIAEANYYPGNLFVQYNTSYDETQSYFYQIMGGVEADWHDLFEQQFQRIEQSTENFRSFTAGGSLHTILDSDAFYERQTDGLRFRDWIEDIAEGRQVENVHCTDCLTEELSTR